MASSILRRRVIVSPHPDLADVYIDDPDGLIWMATWKSLDEAKRQYPGAKVIPQIWDAPVVDPADPSTHRSWDDEEGRFVSDSIAPQ